MIPPITVKVPDFLFVDSNVYVSEFVDVKYDRREKPPMRPAFFFQAFQPTGNVNLFVNMLTGIGYSVNCRDF
jgi:hypothetical protein